MNNKAPVTENKSKEFSREEMRERMRALRAQYGEKKLSEISGMKVLQIRKYCAEGYMQKHHVRQETWEKWFGPWEDETPTFRMMIGQDTVKQIDISTEPEAAAETAEIKTENEEGPDRNAEIKMPRLILEVPSLEDLDATLDLYGMKMIIE